MTHSTGTDKDTADSGVKREVTAVTSTRRAVLGLLTGIASVSMAPSVLAAGVGSALSFRLHDHGTHTRLVLELTEGADFSIFQLTDPLRTVIDLPEIDWSLPGADAALRAGVVRDLRYGLFQPGQSRVVVDLAQPANVDRAFVLAPTASTPWRLVIDLKPVSQAAFLGQTGPANRVLVARPGEKALVLREPRENIEVADASRVNTRAPLPENKPAVRRADRKPVIAIDPGHGGVDPGAIGVSGVREKDITLAAARQLKESLDRTGRYKVVLTRTRDVSLGLRQRIAISRRAAADIFVSLHADSVGRPDVKGLSVYTLSETASDREAAKLAETENKADLIIGMDLTNESTDVRNILIDLAQRESMNLAAHLAAKLISQLKREVTLLRNTHRFAGFAVLKAPDVPSVLLEMGYLSNREEEKSLRQKAYRQKLVVSITRALDSYFADTDLASRI
ncbi:MAG: AMIN domain-containing protein [Rhodospirillaceae bacterium]|jgi:N-acetylmuramoyl-L-alanine amidase|nr:AMIN domain-containing protein [Rhodospirillaceae bacterium]MBT5566650.1 AMIN domain-containing protein [Rhodospirillaceae bacterium]MBT6087984.1 AMIN domain-containing protein [Rhodospirillaceae bacterium]MBT7451252.1 AMIN domain-containing protein [Rhodospirillaceae bacterium]